MLTANPRLAWRGEGLIHGHGLIDATISLVSVNERLTASLYGKNLLNENQFGGDRCRRRNSPACPLTARFALGEGPRVGIELIANF